MNILSRDRACVVQPAALHTGWRFFYPANYLRSHYRHPAAVSTTFSIVQSRERTFTPHRLALKHADLGLLCVR
jgi:hypothetical protein